MTQEFTLYLDDIDQLFNDPHYNPRSAHPSERSGMDTLILQLQLQSMPYPKKLIICLPAEQITPNLSDQTRAAIHGYAELKFNEGAEELVARRRFGVRSLVYGTSFLIVCLFIAYLGQIATFLPPWLSGFIYNGFTIIGWVSLWHPTEAILFDWYEPWRDRRLYRYIETLEVEVKAA